jgi:hypothetical protein
VDFATTHPFDFFLRSGINPDQQGAIGDVRET